MNHPTKEHQGFHEYKNGKRFNPDCPACQPTKEQMKRISDDTIQVILLKKLGNAFCSEKAYELYDTLLQAQLDSCEKEIKEEYPIMYKEEAEFVGWLIDRGWMPPEQYKINLERLEKEHKERIDQAIDAAITAYESTCEALIQEKVKEIFEDIEEHTGADRWGNKTITIGVNNAGKQEWCNWWQALKQEVNDES